MMKEQKKLNYELAILDVADRVHEKFKLIYAENNNGSRVKSTTDEAWINQNGTDRADLAKLKYDELPMDWKNERWCGCKVALDLVLDAHAKEEIFDNDFIEKASSFVHEDWLNRNGDKAEKEHRRSYEDLSKEAKEKDRIFVCAAIETFQET